ncbi:MAG: hypothetical protein R2852_06960 [Bacteroidia bacterium]
MKKRILYSFYIIVFASCNNSNHTTIIEGKSNVTSSSDSGELDSKSDLNLLIQDTLPLNLGCYYKLDDKYSESEDSSEIGIWWRNKLIQFEQHGFQNNLFDNRGGGPNGAEWNSSTDLYIAASIDKIIEDETIELELNKKKITGVIFKTYIPKNKIGSIVHFKLPKDLWETHLRKINANDLKGIYGNVNLDSLRKSSSAPLEIGWIVEVTLTIHSSKNSSITLTDFFHLAYGE